MSKRKRVNDMKYHYTYRITNIKEGKYYYGVHSCDCLPKEDIGIKYFSSSKKEFIKDQKENPQDYKYKVIKIFSTRVEAVQHEIFLHKKFDVKLHQKFYNDANQTSTKFDTTEMTTVFDNIEQKYKSIHISLIDYNTHTFPNSGKIRVFNNTTNSHEYISTHELNTDIHSKSIIPIVCKCYDKNGLTVLVESSVYQQNKHKYTYYSTDTIVARNILTNENIKVSREEFKNNHNLVGATFGNKYKRSDEYIEKFKGSNNGRALKINILNANGNIMYECNGDFKTTCKQNKLPYKQLYESYKTGSLVFDFKSDRGIARIIKLHGIEYYNTFKGWSAVLI